MSLPLSRFTGTAHGGQPIGKPGVESADPTELAASSQGAWQWLQPQTWLDRLLEPLFDDGWCCALVPESCAASELVIDDRG